MIEHHPEYNKRNHLWQFFYDSYSGGEQYLRGGYLETHRLESKKDYSNRLSRAYYLNYCKPIVDIYASYIFKNQILRQSGGSALLENFWKSCFRGGIEFLMRQTAVHSFIYGKVYVFIDRKNVTPAQTRAEDIENIPFCTILPPWDVVNWQKDQGGKFEFVVLRNNTVEIDPNTLSRKVDHGLIKITPTEIIYYSEKGDRINSKDNLAGIVPIVEIKNDDFTVSGNSLIEDIAYINKSIFNYCSLQDESYHRQTFAQLIFPTKSSISSLGLGTAVALKVDPESRHMPKYISPDISQVEALEKKTDSLKVEIYRIASLNKDKYQRQSGISKAYDFIDTNQAIRSKALQLQSMEYQVIEILDKMLDLGIKMDSVNISYPDEFDLKSFDEQLESILEIRGLNIADTLNKQIDEFIAQSCVPDMPKNVLEKIKREIWKRELSDNE